METRERSTAAPAADGDGRELDWRELGRRVRLMRESELLRGLPREHLTTIAPLLHPASARPGELIYREGEPAASFFLVESGTGQSVPGRRRRRVERGAGTRRLVRGCRALGRLRLPRKRPR